MTLSNKTKKRVYSGIFFSRYRRVPNSNKVLDARDYGYKAWPIACHR